MFGVVDMDTGEHLVKDADEYELEDIDGLVVKHVMTLDNPLTGLQLTYQITPDMNFQILAYCTDQGDMESEYLDTETALLDILYKGRRLRFIARKSQLSQKPWWKIW